MKKVKSIGCALLIAVTSMGISTSAFAQKGGEDFATCIINKVTTQDRNNLAKWLFVVGSSNPQVSSFSKVTDKQVDAQNKQVAELFTRILEKDCKAELKGAVAEIGGEAALQGSLQLLAQIGNSHLFQNEAVNKQIAGVDKHIDPKRIEDALK